VEDLEKNGEACCFADTARGDCAVVSQEEMLLDTLMLGLRLADGLSVDEVRSHFGSVLLAKVLEALHPYLKAGWVEIVNIPEQRIKFIDPEGFLFSNVVLSTLFEKLG
jgi:oxygen-independent coproporphyrinogen-3 oxidase